MALTIDEQLEVLRKAYDAGEQDAIGDYGDEVVDSGGWVEIVRAVCDLVGPEVTEEAKKEFCRTQGVAYRAPGTVLTDTDREDWLAYVNDGDGSWH